MFRGFRTNPDLQMFAVFVIGMILIIAGTAISIAIANGGQSGDIPPPLLSTCDWLTDIRVIDGDTLQADIHLGRDVVLTHQYIRLQGYDAWESRRVRRTVRVTDEEIERGKRATEALQGLIDRADSVLLTQAPRGAYGRCEGRLRLVCGPQVIAVEEWMKERGHDRGPTK